MRVNLSTVNKKTIESLIKAGSMDEFGNRAALLIGLSESTSKANQIKKQAIDGQGSLFENSSDIDDQVNNFDSSEVDDFTEEEKLAFEKEFLGIYLSSHPHLETLSRLKLVVTHELDALEEEKEETRIKVGGIIENTKKIFTKKSNSEMAFIRLADEKGISVECVIFPRIFELYKDLLFNENAIVIEGKLDRKDDHPVIIAETIYDAKSQLS